MTIEDEFEKYWTTPGNVITCIVPEEPWPMKCARMAYLAATKRTAERCAEICREQWEGGDGLNGAASAIKKEYGLERD